MQTGRASTHCRQACGRSGHREPKGDEGNVMNPTITISRERIALFCQEHGITRLAVFGSALRESFGPDSDIDLLVEFEPTRIPTLFDIAGMEQDLSLLFGGRRVDLRTPEDLSRYFRDQVIQEAEVQYAAG